MCIRRHRLIVAHFPRLAPAVCHRASGLFQYEIRRGKIVNLAVERYRPIFPAAGDITGIHGDASERIEEQTLSPNSSEQFLHKMQCPLSGTDKTASGARIQTRGGRT